MSATTILPGGDLPASQTDAVVDKYLALNAKGQMSLPEARALSVALARRFAAAETRPDCVVGIANGAIFIARTVADELSLPLHIVLVRRRGSRIKRRLGSIVRTLHIPTSLFTWEPLMPLWRLFQRNTSALDLSADDFGIDLRDQHIALVDDCVETGASIRTARDRLLAAGAASVTTGALCWYRGIGDSGDWEPDLHLHHFTHFYPWSESSIHYAEFIHWLASRGLALRH